MKLEEAVKSHSNVLPSVTVTAAENTARISGSLNPHSDSITGSSYENTPSLWIVLFAGLCFKSRRKFEEKQALILKYFDFLFICFWSGRGFSSAFFFPLLFLQGRDQTETIGICFRSQCHSSFAADSGMLPTSVLIKARACMHTQRHLKAVEQSNSLGVAIQVRVNLLSPYASLEERFSSAWAGFWY